MKLFKKITNPEKVKSFIPAFIIFFLINNLLAVGAENKSDFLKSKNIDNKFEEIFLKNSIPYSAYDNFESQFNLFFGRNSDISERSFYPDLSIINTSDTLREIYRSKLNDMVQK